MNNQLQNLSQLMLPELEAEMRSLFGTLGEKPNPFYGMMQYHMGWVDEEFQPATVHGGKRIRPLLTMLACQASGRSWQRALPAAAAVEILHNFTLVHDDIEDNSPTRRGRKTIWKLWGEPQAINAGDAMFCIAHLAMANLEEQDVPPQSVVRALRRFDQMCLDLTMGQYKDMSFETREDVEVDDYLEMITGKTAVLISLSAELGALIAGQNEETIQHYAEFGRNLGLAFQVIDDILGIWGDESRTGKSTATDIATKKKTLPVLYGLQQSTILSDLYQHAPVDEHFVQTVVEQLDELGSRKFATQKAAHYSSTARQHLQAANPAGEAGEALYQLADILLERDY
jgi:geranylgeranyl diphosphate synthase type I